ncbi:hypothetical protein ACG7TL_001647 [Trametes sanguinea]
MSVMTATPCIDSHERHYVASPQRPPTSTRGDSSSPYAYPYTQKPTSGKMEHWNFPRQGAHHPTPRDVPPPLATGPPQPGSLGAFISAGSVPSLAGSMRFTTATHGLSGAFSGSWSSVRSSLAYSAEPRGSAWTQARERDSDKMDEDEDSGASSSLERGSTSSSSRRPSLANFSRLSSDSLPEVFGRLPAPSESDILLGTSKARLRPATFSPDAQRDRAISWQGEESVRLPPIRQFDSGDYSPRMDASEPPAKRACVQLPSFPDFIEGSSRPSFSASSARSGGSRRGSSSPPPSPSPSVASWSTAARSAGHTDTEPTDEEDAAMSEYQRDQSYSPKGPAAAKQLRPSPLDDDTQHLPLSSHAATGTAQQVTTSGRQAPRSRPSKSVTETEQKKYRFVASKLSHDVSPPTFQPTRVEPAERGRPTAVRPGSKRKHDSSVSPSSPSSVEMPLSAILQGPAPKPVTKPKRQTLPPTQAATSSDAPKRRGRPPRPAYDIESLAPLDPDSPEAKGHFPEYRYEQQRGLMPCAFDGCDTKLTGKKAEMTNHLKTHFHAVGGRTLHCPWSVKDKSGQWVVCGQPFRDSANMGRHVTTRHAKVEEYQCGRCGRPFSRRDAALRHMKTMCSPEKQKAREARRRSFGDADGEWEEEDDEGEHIVWRMVSRMLTESSAM